MRVPARHGRFLAAFALGLAAGLGVLAAGAGPSLALLAGANGLFLAYLVLTLRIVRATGAKALRTHAGAGDEGVALILMLAGLAVVASVTAIFLTLNAETSGFAARALALASLPLGWATVHVLAAFHYAHLHFSGSRPGMIFPGTDAPGAGDFLYASLTIGMAGQVSDVVAATEQMRRAVLVHAVASFFYNTCILALAVNAAVTAGG